MAIVESNKFINPQVMADIIREKVTDKIRFAPLAKVDTTFVGRPGDEITLPRYQYIGDATDVAEGGEITMTLLSHTATTVKVKKAAKGIKMSDEAVLSGYGDPLGEAAVQLAASIAAKVDNDCLDALKGIKAEMTATAVGPITGAKVADALIKFGEDIDGDKVLFIAPEQLASMRNDPNYIGRSDIGTQMMMSGTVGEIWGCQLVVSNKIKEAADKSYTNFIVKPEALAIYLKRDIELETDRDIKFKETVITADQHYVTYLLDESKAIKLVITKPVTTP